MAPETFKRKKANVEADKNGIEDFGEKIGGARKDLWANRGLDISDLDGMTDREAADFTTKHNVWKPDYAALVDGGMDPKAAYLIKIVYDSFPTRAAQGHTSEDSRIMRETYIRQLQFLRDILSKAKTVEDLKEMKVFMEMANAVGMNYLPKKFTENLHTFAYPVYELRKAERIIKETNWPHEPDEAWKKTAFRLGYSIREGYKGLDKSNDWMVVKKDAYGGRLLGEFPTREEAEKALKAIVETQVSESAKNRLSLDRPQFDKMERMGPDYRNGKDVKEEDFQSAFGFRGGEFGNWQNQADRQAVLNHAYDALMDLARVLGIPPRAISLNGELGIAFGARGHGNASAHYEPAKVVINLTKMRGGGALAHEWAHALDDYFGRTSGDENGRVAYISSGVGVNLTAMRPEMLTAFRRIMSTIENGKMLDEAAKAKQEKAVAHYERNVADWIRHFRQKISDAMSEKKVEQQVRAETLAQFDNLAQDVMRKDAKKDQVVAFLDKVSVKIGKTHIVTAKEREALLGNFVRLLQDRKYLAGIEEGTRHLTDKTEFFKTAEALSKKGSDYWVRPQELFARAFEAYIFDRINRNDKSDFLVHSVSNNAYSRPIYPQGIEREHINEAFDNLVSTMKTKETEKGVALYSTTPEGRGAAPSYVSRETVSKHFPGCDVAENRDSTFTVTTPDGTRLQVETVESIPFDKEAFKRAYSRDPRPGELPTGKYENGVVTLARLKGGQWTLTHETLHWLRESGILNGGDYALLRAAAVKAIQGGKQKSVTGEKLGSEENVANFVASTLTNRDRVTGPAARILQKIADWIDRFINVFHRTAGGVLRDIEGGKVYGGATKQTAEAGRGLGAPAYDARRDRPLNTTTSEFKRWFGDSKVVDENGDPLVVYHGTKAPEDFEEFSVGESSANDDDEMVRHGSGGDPRTFLGSHFAKEPSVANLFAKGLYGEREFSRLGGRVIPAYLKIENPFITSDSQMFAEMLDRAYNHQAVDQVMENDAEESGEDVDDLFEKYDNDADFRAKVNDEALDMDNEGDGVTYSLAYDMAKAYQSYLKENGFDGIIYENEVEGGTSYVAFSPEQVKSIWNRGTWDPEDPRMSYATTRETQYVGDGPDAFVVAPDGSLAFGSISKAIADHIGREPGEIRLQRGNDKSGEIHAEKNHGDQIRGLGFEDVKDFVDFVASGYNAIYRGHGESLMLVRMPDDPTRVHALTFVELVPDAEGRDFYTVKTANPSRPSYLKKKRPLWEGAQNLRSQTSTPPRALPGQNNPSSNTVGETRCIVKKTDDESGGPRFSTTTADPSAFVNAQNVVEKGREIAAENPKASHPVPQTLQTLACEHLRPQRVVIPSQADDADIADVVRREIRKVKMERYRRGGKATRGDRKVRKLTRERMRPPNRGGGEIRPGGSYLVAGTKRGHGEFPVTP